MPNSIDSLRQQAARLFALAVEARDKGNVSLADLMTEAAARCVDRVEELERSASLSRPAERQQPVAQQQQQIQPGKGEESYSEFT